MTDIGGEGGLFNYSEHVTAAVGTVTVGATTWVGVNHAVTSLAGGRGLGLNLPVVETLNSLADVADGCTKIANAETSACL